LATETDDAAPASGAGYRRPTALIPGRIDAAGGYKGHAELIDCWHRVVSAVPDARLIIAGGGVGLTVLQRLAAASPVHDSIELRGFTPERELDALWREATVFAMPSRGEGFGLVYAEAMRRGVPVIASVHDAAHEVSIDGETGYNVDLDRQHELPDRLVQLFRGRDHAAVLGENGRRRWRDHFCFSAFKRRFVPLLREFLSD